MKDLELCIGIKEGTGGREGKGVEGEKWKANGCGITHSPFSVSSISGNSRKMVL
jgi:hypothetical protein